MIERAQTNSTNAPKAPAKQPASPPPEEKTAAQPTQSADKVTISQASPWGPNPLDGTPGRTAADVVSGASAVAENAKDIRGLGDVAQRVGAQVPVLSRLSTRVSGGAVKVADWGLDVGIKFPKFGKAFIGFAKAAPFLGAIVAGLDVGKAVIEKRPEKKHIAEGQAAMSVVGGAAGLLAWATLPTPLAPLGMVCVGVSMTATVVSLGDNFFNHGRIAKTIAGWLHKGWQAVTGG